MPAQGESACFTMATAGSAVADRPPSSSTPRNTPLELAYSAARFNTSAAHGMACSSVAAFGMAPPNTRTCAAPILSATSIHFLAFSTSALRSSGVGWQRLTRAAMLYRLTAFLYAARRKDARYWRSEEHTSELQ